MSPGRWRRALALAAALAMATPLPAASQSGTGAQSVEELKAALAELRRRLAEQQAGETAPAEQKLRAAQQQLDRLVAAMGALRRERDSLRTELGAARAELAARSKDTAAAERRLRAAESEVARLRREQTVSRPPVAASAPPEPPPPPEIVVEVLDGAFFASGGADVMPEAQPRLEAIAALIRARPEARVRVVGYTDASGDAAANEALSLARAQSVRGRLAALLAADPERLAVEGRGAADPVADNVTPEGRRANRRVVVTIGP